jgi:fructose-1,6-bisphosphatase I
MDILAHDEFIRCLQRGGECQIVGSEEALTLMSLTGDHIAGRFTVLLDPMDGSDNIDVAAPVGTIFSIFEDDPDEIEDESSRFWNGSAQVAAGYLVYGSSAMFVYTSGSGVNGFTLDPEIGESILSHPCITFPTTPRFFSINTGQANSWSPALAALIDTFCEPGADGLSVTYRYAGSLVADFHRNLLMGGICIYPGTAKNPDGKLRLTYEANPMAFLAEQAGGSATDGETRILDKRPSDLHDHTPLFIGSAELVKMMDDCRARYPACGD